MMHSQMPVQSLLCALLMLPLGMAEGLSDVSLRDAKVQTALAFAVEQYNKNQDDSANYFKQLRLVQAQSQVVPSVEYHLTVDLVKTACKKTAGQTMTFKEIQKCKEPPGNPQKTCYFRVISDHQLNKMNLQVTVCA